MFTAYQILKFWYSLLSLKWVTRKEWLYLSLKDRCILKGFQTSRINWFSTLSLHRSPQPKICTNKIISLFHFDNANYLLLCLQLNAASVYLLNMTYFYIVFFLLLTDILVIWFCTHTIDTLWKFVMQYMLSLIFQFSFERSLSHLWFLFLKYFSKSRILSKSTFFWLFHNRILFQQGTGRFPFWQLPPRQLSLDNSPQTIPT